MNTPNTPLPDMVIEPYTADFAMPNETVVFPFGKTSIAAYISIFRQYSEKGGAVTIRPRLSSPAEGYNTQDFARLTEAFNEAERIAQHLADGNDAQSYVSTHDALLAELARTSLELTEAKKEIDKLQNVLALAVDDQRMTEIMQDMIEWYGDAIKLLPSEKLADDISAQYYIQSRGISPKGTP